MSIGRGDLVVIEGQASRSPRTLHRTATLEDYDLRCWNISMLGGGTARENQLRLTALVDVTDEGVVLDRNDRYIIVVGRDEGIGDFFTAPIA